MLRIHLRAFVRSATQQNGVHVWTCFCDLFCTCADLTFSPLLPLSPRTPSAPWFETTVCSETVSNYQRTTCIDCLAEHFPHLHSPLAWVSNRTLHPRWTLHHSTTHENIINMPVWREHSPGTSESNRTLNWHPVVLVWVPGNKYLNCRNDQ